MFSAIIGMKETKQDVIDIAKSLKALDADSIPVNFLHAIDGTPLEGVNELNPLYCLKVLALFRFINPSKKSAFQEEERSTSAHYSH